MGNGGFTYSKTTEEIREGYIRKSDPLAAFVLDCLEKDEESMIIKQELFGFFAAYCRENNLPAVNKDTFFKNVPKHIPVTQVRTNRKDIPGRPFAFKGIRVSETGQELWSNQSNQSTLSSILMKKAGDRRNNKMGETLDSFDPLDRPQIAVACGSCEFFHTKKCSYQNPDRVTEDAPFAAKCKNYREASK